MSETIKMNQEQQQFLESLRFNMDGEQLLGYSRQELFGKLLGKLLGKMIMIFFQKNMPIFLGRKIMRCLI